jgi:MOSC domain-containing protein YiiM
LLIEGEALRELGLSPGVVRENITTEGIRLAELEAGRRLRAGEAVLEVTVPCEPCDHMDAIRPGLKGQLRGRRGILCRVIESGLIRRGDALEVIELATTRNVQNQGGA